MTMITRLHWLEGRLESRAKDARQAEQNARGFDPNSYPASQRLADVHATAAAVYERALADVRKELEEIK